jgi:hypothetical protein
MAAIVRAAWGRDLVAACAAGLDDEALPAKLPQVVSGLADGVAVVAGHRPDPGCVLGDGEAVGCGGQRECCREGGADPGLVQVDAADPGNTDPGGQRQLIEGPVVEETDIDAVDGRAEPLRHAGQAGDDLGEVLQAAAAAQFSGVVGVQHDPVYAVIGARQQIRVPLGEVISHASKVPGSSRPVSRTARRATPSGRSPGRSVAILWGGDFDT